MAEGTAYQNKCLVSCMATRLEDSHQLSALVPPLLSALSSLCSGGCSPQMRVRTPCAVRQDSELLYFMTRLLPQVKRHLILY